MAQVKWSKRALSDLRFIYDYIAIDSVFYAERYINKLISRVDQLETLPESGRIVPEKNDLMIRELIEGNYRIFYKIQRGHIFILRIHHAARNIT
ncbi:MAG: type II toxin-antitoxin system RelE/ParE family toxin [Bacteroidota bacterium]|jgi:toxin ParE1/3/4